MKKLAALVVPAFAVSSVAGVSTARGDAPTIVDSTRFVAPSNAPNITAACGFTVLQTFTLETRTITFTGDTGNVTRRVGAAEALGLAGVAAGAVVVLRFSAPRPEGTNHA